MENVENCAAEIALRQELWGRLRLSVPTLWEWAPPKILQCQVTVDQAEAIYLRV